MPYTGTPPGGADHGPSIKNPAVYEAMVREGASKGKAAAVSNSQLRKGIKKGRHGSVKSRRHGRARGHR